MRKQNFGITVGSKTTGAIILGAFLLLLMVHPVRTLLGEWQYHRALVLIDDPLTDRADVIDLDGDTIGLFERSLKHLERAHAAVPAEVRYLRKMSGIHALFGEWNEVMTAMGVALPQGSETMRMSYLHAQKSLMKAIEQSPADASLHLDLGILSFTMGELDIMDIEFKRAVSFYPVNSAMRYAVALRYLLAKRNADALQQARELAVRDDSYVMQDTARARLLKERNLSEYRARLQGSYLSRALGILWRAGKREPTYYEELFPQGNHDGREAVRLFLEGKGLYIEK